MLTPARAPTRTLPATPESGSGRRQGCRQSRRRQSRRRRRQGRRGYLRGTWRWRAGATSGKPGDMLTARAHRRQRQPERPRERCRQRRSRGRVVAKAVARVVVARAVVARAVVVVARAVVVVARAVVVVARVVGATSGEPGDGEPGLPPGNLAMLTARAHRRQRQPERPRERCRQRRSRGRAVARAVARVTSGEPGDGGEPGLPPGNLAMLTPARAPTRTLPATPESGSGRRQGCRQSRRRRRQGRRGQSRRRRRQGRRGYLRGTWRWRAGATSGEPGDADGARPSPTTPARAPTRTLPATPESGSGRRQGCR